MGQERLLYSFNLENHIPANHLLCSIDRCLYLSDLFHYLIDFYSPIGRPSFDPELMIRMLGVGYCYGSSVLKVSPLNMEDLRFVRKIFLQAYHEQPMVLTRFEARRVILK